MPTTKNPQPAPRHLGSPTQPVQKPTSNAAQRQQDLGLLKSILSDGNSPELNAGEKRAFQDMHASLRSQNQVTLSGSQRRWANEVWHRLKPISAATVPVGRPVPTPAVLQDPKAALQRKPPPPAAARAPKAPPARVATTPASPPPAPPAPVQEAEEAHED